MEQETLKKIVELADGFENLTLSMDLLCVEFNTWDEKISIALKYVPKWEHYPLLLRRAVEGWNKNNNTKIVIGSYAVSNQNYGVRYKYEDYKKTEYLTPQEQAIEACLIELLEGK